MQKSVKFSLFLALFLTVLHLAAQVQPVKYVFLFIGDGMALQQRIAAEQFSKATRGKGLIINAMPASGLTTTHSASSSVTDSAASGTAIACGTKTTNGVLGLDVNGKKLESVAEVAFKNGRKVAIISSVPINHATPAAFYAKQSHRSKYYAIGEEAIASNFDYFGGGGFLKSSDNGKTDLYALAAKSGYTVARTIPEARALKTGKGKIISTPYGASLPLAIDKTPEDLRLAFFVKQAIAHLGTEKPFFIMAEGGSIDSCGHANDGASNVRETLEFDDAVAVAYEFYKKHPKDTLIVVTGDHETGGMSLGCEARQQYEGGLVSKTRYSFNVVLAAKQTKSLYGIRKHFEELYAAGKLASWDMAKKEITAVSGLIFSGKSKGKSSTRKLSAKEEKLLKSIFEKEFAKDRKCDKLHRQIVDFVNAKAGIGWTTGSHTGIPLNTTAVGKNMEMFSNMYDNTDIAKRLKLMVK